TRGGPCRNRRSDAVVEVMSGRSVSNVGRTVTPPILRPAGSFAARSADPGGSEVEGGPDVVSNRVEPVACDGAGGGGIVQGLDDNFEIELVLGLGATRSDVDTRVVG